MRKVKKNDMVKLKFLALYLINITAVFAGENNLSKSDRDHEKAIRAVNEGEILPLDKILKKVESEYVEESYL